MIAYCLCFQSATAGEQALVIYPVCSTDVAGTVSLSSSHQIVFAYSKAATASLWQIENTKPGQSGKQHEDSKIKQPRLHTGPSKGPKELSKLVHYISNRYTE